MRLPLPLLLYVAAIGLLGWTGWTVYEMLPLWQVQTQAHDAGAKASEGLVAKGKGQGAIAADWRYTDGAWWARFRDVNLIGKLPPPPPDPEKVKEAAPPPPPPVDMRPLEQIIELVSLVHDGADGGTGGNSHVILRYTTEANVTPPEWWVRENMAPMAAGTAGGPRDVAAAAVRGQQRNPRASNGPPTTAPTVGMPTSLTGRVMQQTLYVSGDGDPRRGNRLWAPFEHIRLVRVAPDAQSAFFLREIPPAAGSGAAPEPKEEELLKTAMNLSQDVLREMRRLQGRDTAATTSRPEATQPVGTAWREVEETTRFGNSFHIGRQDETRFRENADDFLNKVYLDTYSGKSRDYSGLQVRSVEPQIATRFGVVTGDVLLEVNGRKVESRAQTVNMVKKDYNNGVRSFTTRWLSNGQVVERVYQTRDR